VGSARHLPHEHTLSKPKDDRLHLLRACAANLSPIMALYDDADHIIAKQADCTHERVTAARVR